MNLNHYFLSSLLLLQIPNVPIKAASSSIVQNSICKIERQQEFYSTKELQTLASKITVKVIGDNNNGSGTIIGKEGNNYLVLTNAHVIQGVNSIKLQTADGKTYSAEILDKNQFEKSDLALLKFQSNQSYCLPEISTVTPEIHTTILAAGFSDSTGNIVFSSGEVKKTSNLKEGYEIGYSSNIEQGMSGGAILNSLGQLVGINGRSAYPILNSGYVYQNGKLPRESEIRAMRKLSWGISISTVLEQVDSDVLSAYKLPLPKGSTTIPEAEYTGWLGDLEQKAKQFTVRIDSSSNANGSGIIIAKEGNTYTVLTAAHVVCERVDATKPCGEFKYEILAPDGNKYFVDKSSIKIEQGVDLAVVKFKSYENYKIATLANYNPNNKDYIFTAGYPELTNSSPWRFTVGKIFDKESGLIIANQSDFQNLNSDQFQTYVSLTGGYELVYSSITYGGMSGGSVLDSQGRVIGIHGRAEGAEEGFQIGYSLGIPVDTFLELAPRLDVKPQKLENNKPPQLNAQKKKSIEEAMLSVDVSGGNATASQWLERGNQLWRLGRYKQAVKAYDQAIKQKPSFVYLAYYCKGLALGNLEKTQEGITAFNQAVKLKPNFVAGWESLSVFNRELKQLDKALVAINKAIQLQPQNPNLYNEKFVVLQDLKDYVQAEAAITEAIKLSPRASFYNNRGNIYNLQKKWELALADYNKVIQINPEHALVYGNRGILYTTQEKWNLALADYNKAIQINPENALFYYYYRGMIYRVHKKWELALADYNKAIQINPENALFYSFRADVYEKQKKWELALADYNKAIQINPENALFYSSRGMSYLAQKKWDLAIADYSKAIQIDPKNANFYQFRGISYRAQKKWDLAIADYSKAIQINPENTRAYKNRAHLYEKQKKLDLAIADYSKAIQLNPEDASNYKVRGIFYIYQKKWDLALADFNKFIQINPEIPFGYYARGDIYKNQKKWDLALADYSKFIQINPENATVYYERGNIYHNQKKSDLALADYSKVIQINPKHAYAYYNRGILYIGKSEQQKAIQDLEKAAQLFKAKNNNVGYQKVMSSLQKLQK